MALKNARIGKAEDLPTAEQKRLGINSGLIIIESRNDDLREEIIPLKEGGIRDYLITHCGTFKDVPLDE